MSSIASHLAGFKMSSCLYNASGAWCTTNSDLRSLNQSFAGALITKSATPFERNGNPAPRYVDVPLGSLNAMGLPNMGIDFYISYAKEHLEESHKPLFLSIAGLTLEDNLYMLKRIEASGLPLAVELNLSCPNLPGKPQTAYDFNRTEQVLKAIFSFYKGPLGVKLPPYFDDIHFEQITTILNHFPLSFVTCINSIGNALCIDLEKQSTQIKPKLGFGGLGGTYIKPTALANVRKMYLLLRKDIDVVGCGGVTSGSDVFEHILCGASAVQVGTKLMQEGPSCFERLENQLKDLMQKKGYAQLIDFKGKLNEL